MEVHQYSTRVINYKESDDYRTLLRQYELLNQQLENTKKENSGLLVIRQQSSGYEMRIKSLTEEVNALRAALGEREDIISKMRVEVHQYSTRVINYKESDDYRALQNQYELILQQLEASRTEIRNLRDQSEKYRSEILVIKSSSESGVSSIRYELESAKSENARLTQIVEALRIELEKTKKENSELLIIRQQSGGFEFRVKSLTEEVNSLRSALTERDNIISKLRIDLQSTSESAQKLSSYELRIKSLIEEINSLRTALVEREESISKMRVEINQYSTKVINYRDSDDYRSLLKQYELILQQLDAAKVEIRTVREQSEKYRSEILVIKSSSESGVASIRYELESAKSENARLTQIVEALRTELENTKKENSGLLIIRQQSGGFELRVKSLTEEVNALRAALAEREDIISKMRMEVHQYSTRVINYKESDDYRTLLRQYELLSQQLENTKKENSGLLIIRQQSSGYEMRIKSLTEEVNALRAALAEREEIISKMRVEVHQYTTRVINYKESDDYRTLLRQYEQLIQQLENTKKENSQLLIIRQQSGGYELRVKSLTEEVNALRSALAEREDIISKMRMEVHQYSTRVINYKVSKR
jgi:chromosome segregation ATPase